MPGGGDQAVKYCHKPEMKESRFKKSIVFSFLGHLTVFSIFVVSFGNKLPSWGQTDINFWGDILHKRDFANQDAGAILLARRMPAGPFLEQQLGGTTDPQAAANISLTLASCSLKPISTSGFQDKKLSVINKPALLPPALKKKQEVVMFHPVLPYHFSLYFKDRQVVNIELMYKVTKHGASSSVAIQRRISSGNLEVDLLAMRHISHYLFIQQDRLTPDLWQKVKIEFSPHQEASGDDRY